MLQKVLQLIKNLLRFHKAKFVALSVLTVIFLVLLFPFGDLSDLITTEVAEQTNNQVYLQFDDLGISLFPQPGIKMSKVLLESASLPAVQAESLAVAPSLSALLAFKVGMSAYAQGIFDGNLGLSFQQNKVDNGIRQSISIGAEALDMTKLAEFLAQAAAFSLNMKGALSLESDLTIDPEFKEQPKGPVTLEIENLVLPPNKVPTQMGELQTPDLKLSTVSLKGKMQEGNLIIEQATLGKGKDELIAKLSGQISIALHRGGTGVMTDVGAYDFKVDLNVQNSFYNRAQLFLLLFDNYKSPTANGFHYAFRVSAPRINNPPQIQPIQ